MSMVNSTHHSSSPLAKIGVFFLKEGKAFLSFLYTVLLIAITSLLAVGLFFFEYSKGIPEIMTGVSFLMPVLLVFFVGSYLTALAPFFVFLLVLLAIIAPKPAFGMVAFSAVATFFMSFLM